MRCLLLELINVSSKKLQVLFYGKAVVSTLLTDLAAIMAQQVNPVNMTINQVKEFLDYCPMHGDAMILCQASNMILNMHSDAGYLNDKDAHSQTGGPFLFI